MNVETDVSNESLIESFEERNPFKIFQEWMALAEKSEPNDPTAMALATVDSDGMPNVRMVLLKGFDEVGFVFYTNLESDKGRELAEGPKAALCFHWKSLRRQIRVRGTISSVTGSEADTYYASRARGSRIGAWASKQSRPLESRFALEKEVAKFTAKYAIGDIPRPEHWSGFRLAPRSIEFWQDRKFRLHDRIRFMRSPDEDTWSQERLYP